ncbi:hypothetical protein [Xenophilus sp. Marseille-Q4582]|uniref:hypothetical protein n=1 Tax=Xenophilus sp. Marseille-Q4582 TaxID=2866600 RepID=UPI001CE48421|nr:hypothetical protein [Xenophilus sp. Marseille-Q4582]
MNQSDQDGDLPAFARSILGGKKTSKLEARISDEVKEAVRRRWVDLGFGSESEYLETLVTVDVFGKAHVRMVQERRLAMVGGASDTGPTGLGALS